MALAVGLLGGCGEAPVERGTAALGGFAEDPRIAPEDILDEGEALLSRIDVEMEEAQWAALRADPGSREERPCAVTLGGRRYEGVEIELHGGFARTAPKKSFRIKFAGERPFYDAFGEGPERLHRLVLQASWIDRTFMRNKLTMDLIRAQGGLSPRVSYAELVVNGRYEGLYTVIERIDEDFVARQGWSPAGNLYKAENHNANWGQKADPLNGFKKMLGEGQPSGDLGELLRVIHATPLEFERFEAEVGALLSLEDFMVFSAAHIFAMNTDTFTKNYYLYHDPLAGGGAGGRFRLVSWDADATFANNWDGAAIEAGEGRLIGHDRLSPRLFGIPEYEAMHLERLRGALEGGDFSPEAMRERTAALREQFRSAAGRDAIRWRERDTFEGEVDRLDGVFEVRRRALLEAMDR